MKTLLCLTALSLVACVAPFEDRQATQDDVISQAGATDAIAGSGGSAGQIAQAGKAGAPPNAGGSDSGMAGTPSAGSNNGVGGNLPMAGMAGKAPEGSAGSGMAGMPSAGNGNAGSPSMAGAGGSDSPAAGTGGMDSGSGGTPATSNDCDATGRVGNWSPIEWVSNTGSPACTTRLNQIGHGLLTLSLQNGCTWAKDITSPDSWMGCNFVNTLVCPVMGTEQAFTAQVSSHFVGSDGQLGGSVTFDSTTAGDCSGVSSVSFTATRN